MVKYWISASDLGSVVSRSLVKLIKTHPAIGWVKADVLPDKSIVEENLQLRKTVDQLTNQLEESRTTAPQGTENLAQGNDVVELNFTFGGYKSNDWDADVSYKHSFKVSWNDIFARLSPVMINESSESNLKHELDTFVRDINFESLSSHEALKDYRLKDFSLHANDFNTIKIQLLALNLIKKSDKSRSVKDKATYWTLTPYGESTMVKLRAVKRPGTESDVPKPAPSNKEIEVETPNNK